jgi:hypothetical protein
MSTGRAALWVLGGLAGIALSGAGFAWYRISNPSYGRLALPERLVSAESETGRRMLASAEARADHVPLSRWFVSQEKLSWCGPASATIVLNAMSSPPAGEALTQRGLFTREARQVRGKLQTSLGGMSLDELGQLLRAHGAIADVVHAEETDFLSFRRTAGANLADDDNFLIVNYDRTVLGQAGAGHISPVAAWDQSTKRLLVLDTAAYWYPPTWVAVTDLWAAMDTVDDRSGRTRGYIVVRPSP